MFLKRKKNGVILIEEMFFRAQINYCLMGKFVEKLGIKCFNEMFNIFNDMCLMLIYGTTTILRYSIVTLG